MFATHSTCGLEHSDTVIVNWCIVVWCAQNMLQDDCSFMWHPIVPLSTLLWVWWIFKNMLWMIMKGYSHSFRIARHKSMCSKHSDFPAYTDWTELWPFWLSGLYWLNWTLNILTFRPILIELNSDNILTFRPILIELNSDNILTFQPILETLHWLPITHHIQYKISTICFISVSGTAPLYLSDLLQPYSYTPARQLRLHPTHEPLSPLV